jgi:hypothetical protein
MDRAPTVGAGAVAEAVTLKGIFGTNQNEFQRETLLALLPDVPGDVVPEDLNRLLRFRIAELTRDGIDDLLRAIFSAPKHVAAPVGSPPQFDEPRRHSDGSNAPHDARGRFDATTRIGSTVQS